MQASLLDAQRLGVDWENGTQSRFHLIWLRDNCHCEGCRVALSGERLLYIGDFDAIPALDKFRTENDHLHIDWADGHRSRFSAHWLKAHDYSQQASAPNTPRTLWQSSLDLPRFDYADVTHSDQYLLDYLDALDRYGIALIKQAPAVPGTAETFARRIGIVREVAFGRVHDVLNNPDGYNVAHTAKALPLHTDLASYPTPPSGQVLHYLVNEVDGGDTLFVDGWQAVEQLRAAAPGAFDLLRRTRVHIQLYSDDKDTRCCEPLIDCYPDGTLKLLRFSNQTMLPIRLPEADMADYYTAYQAFSKILADPGNRFQHKAENGDLFLVNNHRVLHGRTEFDPSSGARHLQDVYVEWADVMATARVLRGHLPDLP